jgi:hypothetical protein
MAGHDNCHRVAIVGHADGTKCVWLADCAGDVGVGARLAIGNRQQCAPAGKLEIGAAKIEREGELAAVAGEIFFQFSRYKPQRARDSSNWKPLFLSCEDRAGWGESIAVPGNRASNSRATSPCGEAARNNGPIIESIFVQ